MFYINGRIFKVVKLLLCLQKCLELIILISELLRAFAWGFHQMDACHHSAKSSNVLVEQKIDFAVGDDDLRLVECRFLLVEPAPVGVS